MEIGAINLMLREFFKSILFPKVTISLKNVAHPPKIFTIANRVCPHRITATPTETIAAAHATNFVIELFFINNPPPYRIH